MANHKRKKTKKRKDDDYRYGKDGKELPAGDRRRCQE